MLYLILLLIALELINIHMVLGKNASEYQQYLRSVCTLQNTSGIWVRVHTAGGEAVCQYFELCSLLSDPELLFSVGFSASQ